MTIKELNGDAILLRDGKSEPLSLNTKLLDNDVIQPLDAEVILTFNDGRDYKLAKGELFKIDQAISQKHSFADEAIIQDISNIQNALANGGSLEDLEATATGNEAGVSLSPASFAQGGHESIVLGNLGSELDNKDNTNVETIQVNSGDISLNIPEVLISDEVSSKDNTSDNSNTDNKSDDASKDKPVIDDKITPTPEISTAKVVGIEIPKNFELNPNLADGEYTFKVITTGFKEGETLSGTINFANKISKDVIYDETSKSYIVKLSANELKTLGQQGIKKSINVNFEGTINSINGEKPASANTSFESDFKVYDGDIRLIPVNNDGDTITSITKELADTGFKIKVVANGLDNSESISGKISFGGKEYDVSLVDGEYIATIPAKNNPNAPEYMSNLTPSSASGDSALKVSDTKGNSVNPNIISDELSLNKTISLNPINTDKYTASADDSSVAVKVDGTNDNIVSKYENTPIRIGGQVFGFSESSEVIIKNGDTVIAKGSVLSNGSWSADIDPTTLNDGTYNLNVSIGDTISNTQTLIVDRTDPSINIEITPSFIYTLNYNSGDLELFKTKPETNQTVTGLDNQTNDPNAKIYFSISDDRFVSPSQIVEQNPSIGYDETKGKYFYKEPLNEGLNVISVIADDGVNSKVTKSFNLYLDSIAPKQASISFDELGNAKISNNDTSTTKIAFAYTDENGAPHYLNAVLKDGSWSIANAPAGVSIDNAGNIKISYNNLSDSGKLFASSFDNAGNTTLPSSVNLTPDLEIKTLAIEGVDNIDNRVEKADYENGLDISGFVSNIKDLPPTIIISNGSGISKEVKVGIDGSFNTTLSKSEILGLSKNTTFIATIKGADSVDTVQGGSMNKSVDAVIVKETPIINEILNKTTDVSNGETNNYSPSIKGSEAEANTNLNIYYVKEGSTEIKLAGSTQADNNGDFSLDLAANNVKLSDGNYKFFALASNEANNKNLNDAYNSLSKSVTIDTKADYDINIDGFIEPRLEYVSKYEKGTELTLFYKTKTGRIGEAGKVVADDDGKIDFNFANVKDSNGRPLNILALKDISLADNNEVSTLTKADGSYDATKLSNYFKTNDITQDNYSIKNGFKFIVEKTADGENSGASDVDLNVVRKGLKLFDKDGNDITSKGSIKHIEGNKFEFEFNSENSQQSKEPLGLFTAKMIDNDTNFTEAATGFENFHEVKDARNGLEVDIFALEGGRTLSRGSADNFVNYLDNWNYKGKDGIVRDYDQAFAIEKLDIAIPFSFASLSETPKASRIAWGMQDMWEHRYKGANHIYEAEGVKDYMNDPRKAMQAVNDQKFSNAREIGLKLHSYFNLEGDVDTIKFSGHIQSYHGTVFDWWHSKLVIKVDGVRITSAHDNDYYYEWKDNETFKLPKSLLIKDGAFLSEGLHKIEVYVLMDDNQNNNIKIELANSKTGHSVVLGESSEFIDADTLFSPRNEEIKTLYENGSKDVITYEKNAENYKMSHVLLEKEDVSEKDIEAKDEELKDEEEARTIQNDTGTATEFVVDETIPAETLDVSRASSIESESTPTELPSSSEIFESKDETSDTIIGLEENPSSPSQEAPKETEIFNSVEVSGGASLIEVNNDLMLQHWFIEGHAPLFLT